MNSIKGRAATEQDALTRIYQHEEREGGTAVQIRLMRAQDGSVEYSALIVDKPNIVQERSGT
jgi:hypothetical protein